MNALSTPIAAGDTGRDGEGSRVFVSFPKLGAEVSASAPLFGGWQRKQNRGRKPGRWTDERRAAHKVRMAR